MGTLMYGAPEQMSEQPPDKRSDLYALGVVLYEMIAGRPPFTGEYEAAIRAAILNDRPEPLARYKAGVPDDIQRIVSKLLAKEPKLRYQTAEDLLADLSRLETRQSAISPGTRSAGSTSEEDTASPGSRSCWTPFQHQDSTLIQSRTRQLNRWPP